jgi:AraC-like DNA-binding protein
MKPKLTIKIIVAVITIVIALTKGSYAQSFSKDIKTELELDSLNILINSDAEKAKSIIEKLKHTNNNCLQYNGQYYEAMTLYVKGDYQKAKELLTPLLVYVKNNSTLFEKYCYDKLVFKIVNRLFFIEKNFGNYNKALELLETNLPYLDADVLPFLYGTAQMGLGNYEDAIQLFKQDINAGYIAKRIQKTGVNKSYSIALAQRYNALGDAYQKLFLKSHKENILDSADYYYTKAAVAIKPQDKIPEFTEALLMIRKAKSYTLKQNYTMALELYRTRIQYSAFNNRITESSYLDLLMADCFLKLKQTDSAIYYANNFLIGYAKKPTSIENLATGYYILSACYGLQKDNEKAYTYAQKNMDLTKQMQKTNKEALDFIHNYDIKTIKAQYQSVSDSNNRNKKLWISTSAALLLLLTGYILYEKRKKKIKKQLFLEIVNALPNNESLVENNDSLLVKGTPVVTIEPSPVGNHAAKQSIDEDSVLKITEGLQKLEKNKLFLKSYFKLAYVAKKLNTNTVYLSNYFNHTKNQTFSAYVQTLRIQFVLNELKNNIQFRYYTLQAIAETIGYKNANTFVAVFKKATGISPNLYIQQLNKKAA